MTNFVRAGDLRIAFDREGDGPPLLLMHGAEASRLMFAALVPHLSKYFTVIAYDQRDCGETEGPDRPSTLADLAKDAQELMKALGFRRAHVFGSSFGGRVAQALALLYPRVVDHLVLASTWPLPRPYEELCPDARQLGELRRGLPDTAEELATWFFPEAFLEKRPELRCIFAQARPESTRSSSRAATVATALDMGVADIVAPTLVLAGELDRVVPPAVTLAMSGRIRGADAAMLPGIGHVTAMQAPEVLAHHIVRFLSPQGTKQ
ncbi:alpha/beta fold hydrolase [Variovorax ginsengisoli]|uniref:Alpha/beta hydrolase n=1 Tax=Variovorax ginsengisoli TaxID=363844 RepID=A0ABT8SFK1_9BURK|nr:alpha/beta hydrolase [Variovorax ginsengisoli]MDN8617772.1 alpha/beta hydrolase [Variovorax ginsengisoli]MDO1536942.1 alpha/beta hydrolase [Variovorax ginsengisoli]